MPFIFLTLMGLFLMAGLILGLKIARNLIDY